MLDNRKVVARGQFLAYRMQANHVGSVGDVEFGFPGEVRRSSRYESFRDDQFCFQSNKVEEGAEAQKYSPPLWKKNSTNTESSPLLPSDHHYSNLSPPTRLQAIVEARKELMEMIRSMPENNYELSLKDLVDEQQQQTVREENKEEGKVAEDDERRSFRVAAEDQIKNHKKKKKKKVVKKMKNIKSSSSGGHQISRSTSMDSGIFLIKIFFPSFLGSKRKLSTNKSGCSKVSPRTSFEISEKENDNHDDHREHWIKSIVVAAGENIGNGKNCSSTKSNNSSTKRAVVSHYFSPGCWPFLHAKKSKATGQHRGCFF